MKYKCNACDNEDACFHEYGGLAAPFLCPYGCSAGASWIKTTPDPHVVTSADMSRQRRDEGSTGEPQVEDSFKAPVKPQPKGGVAEDNDVKSRVEKLEDEVYRGMTVTLHNLEHKVVDLDARLELAEEACEVDNKRLNVLETKPQPKGGVALDKEGMPHDLIPGVSVYELPEGGCERIFHHQVNNTTFGYQCLGSAKVADWLAPDRTEAVTWLRDLDFPPHMGGDK